MKNKTIGIILLCLISLPFLLGFAEGLIGLSSFVSGPIGTVIQIVELVFVIWGAIRLIKT